MTDILCAVCLRRVSLQVLSTQTSRLSALLAVLLMHFDPTLEAVNQDTLVLQDLNDPAVIKGSNWRKGRQTAAHCIKAGGLCVDGVTT